MAITLLTVSAISSSASAQLQSAPSGQPSQTERLAELIRFWNYVRLFHIDDRAIGPAWDTSLALSAERAFYAPNDGDFHLIAAEMLERLQPGYISKSDAETPAVHAAVQEQVRMVDGTPVASCRALADALAQQEPMEPFRDAMLTAIRKRGLILDCRGFSMDARGFQQRFLFTRWMSNVAPGLISKTVKRGSIRQRFHDGFPPDAGQSTGGYASGVLETDLGTLAGQGPPDMTPKTLVFLFDRSSPEPWSLAGGLQAAGLAKIVAQGSIAEPGLEPFKDRALRVLVRVREYVSPAGRTGFRADTCVGSNASRLAMVRAHAILAGAQVPACTPRHTHRSPAAPTIETEETEPLSFGQRMVALAKLWGTIEYFFPYRGLTDRPWSDTLEEFVPIFAEAKTREAYESAVVLLTKRLDDSHAFVSGTQVHPLGSAFSPPLYVRPVASTFAIGGLHDATLADRLRVGDELIAVDGQSVASVASAWRSIFAASTEQALRARVSELLTSGSKGSQARLTFRRGLGGPFDVILPRTIAYWEASSKPKSRAPSFSRLAGGDVGYIDLERLSSNDADRAMDELMDTRAIIFDLRGYPQGTAWTLTPRLALDGRQGTVAALFRRPTYRGPSAPQQNWTTFAQTIPIGERPRYRGRIIVLIDDRAISQSEHTALFFKAAAKPLFVGSPTTGADGDVTFVALPGDLRVSFTGHDVRHSDGQQLQRIGIQPDIRIEPTLVGMRAGRDEVLEAGIEQARRD